MRLLILVLLFILLFLDFFPLFRLSLNYLIYQPQEPSPWLFGGFDMLRNWQLHKDYQNILRHKLMIHLQMERSRVKSLDKAITKLYLLDLDNLLPIVKPLYSDLGRPAKNQQGIIRSLVLMLELQEYSITKWALRVRNDLLLFDICGFDSTNAPSVVSYYDLLVRFT